MGGLEAKAAIGFERGPSVDEALSFLRGKIMTTTRAYRDATSDTDRPTVTSFSRRFCPQASAVSLCFLSGCSSTEA